MFKSILFAVVCSSLLFSGCSAFRELFDESPKERSAKVERRKRKSEKGHRFQDPMHDMFKVKNDSPILPGSNLSSYEREVIDAHRRSNVSDIESIKREGERARKARQEWVFGKNPFD